MRNIFILLSLGLILFSCKYSLEEKYKDNFTSYLNKEHRVVTDKVSNAIFYVIDIDSDCICTELNMKVATESYEKLTKKGITFYLILIGKARNENDLDKYLTNPQIKKYIIRDEMKNIFRYETGFYKPMIAHIKNRDYIFFKIILDFEIGDIQKYILNVI